MQTAVYVRVSTDKQETGLEAQLMACKEYCKRHDISDYVVFSEEDESGGKESRPEFDRMLEAIERGEFQQVLVYCLSRLTRSLIQSQMLAADFARRGVTLLSCSETLDFETPEGRLLYAILGAVNQYQREDIVRKVKNGLKNAREKGVRLGRERTNDYEAIWVELERGMSERGIMHKLGVSRGAVRRAKAAMPGGSAGSKPG